MAMLRRYGDRAGLRPTVGLCVALGIWLLAPAKGPFSPAEARAQAVGPYAGGDERTMPLEELLNDNRPLTGSIRTRGILEAGARIPGTIRRYSLTLPSDRLAATVLARLPITPSTLIRDAFDFDADSLNMREIEVVGTFQPGTGSGAVVNGGFWFWAYSEAGGDEAADRSDRRRGDSTGLLAIEDLAGRPARLAKESVRVRGQFRGKNLFGDLPPAGAPADGWVIKDGGSAVWVSGKRPKGNGWSLDPESRSDSTRWVEVVGKVETREGVLILKADKVELVAPPKPDAE